MRKYRVQGLLASVSLIAALTVIGVGQAAAQPDLVPIVTAPMSANVGVQNIGDSPAPASQLIISCDKLGKAGGGGCPDAPDLGIYENPAYPQHATIEVPELAPGESYNHVLSVWDDMVWPEGTYIFSVTADAGNAAVEANEFNNDTQTSYTQLPQPGIGQKPQLPLQTRPAVPHRQKPAKATIVAPQRLPVLKAVPAKPTRPAPQQPAPRRSTN